MADHRITLADLNIAHEAFQEIEPRGLFYKAARELVDLAFQRRTSLTVAEALAVLLQTWNKNYYRFHKDFDARHFDEIEELLGRYEVPLAAYRKQKQRSFTGTVGVQGGPRPSGPKLRRASAHGILGRLPQYSGRHPKVCYAKAIQHENIVATRVAKWPKYLPLIHFTMPRSYPRHRRAGS
jgi:hypothetical protein